MTVLEQALLGAAVVGLCATLWLLRERWRLRAERDLLAARLADAERLARRERKAFEASAAKAVRRAGSQLVRLAEAKLGEKTKESEAELARREVAVEALVAPIRETLHETRAELRRLETERAGHYRSLARELRGVARASGELRRETGQLVGALRKPTVRWRYGEVQLERVVELAGLRSWCDFDVQAVVRRDAGDVQRPDMVVRLPSERVLVVDAKTPLDGYLDALEASEPAEVEAALDGFAASVERQMRALARKEYWAQFERSPEFVVMFVPGDQFVDAALERRAGLLELAAKHDVVLASPTSLLALLRAVHLGWREVRIDDGARQLHALGRELLERAQVAFGHAGELGGALAATVEHYNRLVASTDSRLLPTLRKLADHGVEPVQELRPPGPVDATPRAPAAEREEGAS